MGRRRYPPLTPSDVVRILEALGFKYRNQVGSHKHYERVADQKRRRSVVTVDMAIGEFADPLIKNMIDQSGFSRDQFYGATKYTANKAQVKLYAVR